MLSRTQALVVACVALAPAGARAHPLGGPAVAWPIAPHRVGERSDRAYRFTWSDTNFRTPTGTISIDWFYTRAMPPTFQLGVTPPDLEGTPIVLGIDEEDRTDAYTWDTSTVAPGSYWIWSRVHDLPGETSLRINAFSRGVITVAHPGDVVHPAIAMVSPDSPFAVADGPAYPVAYEAFDPDGTGVVTLEAMRSRGGEDAVVIADGLPAARSATVTWALADVADGDWILRARLVDGRGLTATAYGRFVLTVEHLDAGTSEAGVARADGGSADIGAYDAGAPPAVDTGCGCATRARGSGAAELIVVALAAWAIARRRARR